MTINSARNSMISSRPRRSCAIGVDPVMCQWTSSVQSAATVSRSPRPYASYATRNRSAFACNPHLLLEGWAGCLLCTRRRRRAIEDLAPGRRHVWEERDDLVEVGDFEQAEHGALGAGELQRAAAFTETP